MQHFVLFSVYCNEKRISGVEKRYFDLLNTMISRTRLCREQQTMA
jgi:hypothetical protein